MSALRWLGVATGAFGLITLFLLFRRRRVRRVDFVIGTLLGLALLIVSSDPGAVSVLRDMLALERAQFSRLIAILVLSSALLWVVLLYTRVRWADHWDHFDRLVRRLGIAEFRANLPLAKPPAILVVLPARDEADNVGIVLAAIPKRVCDRDVAALVVDDGSRDGTAAVALEAGALAVSTLRRGGGAALRLGFDIAEELGAEIAVSMDADGQHLPEDLEGLVRPVVAGNLDLVIGSRLLGRQERANRLRLIGIHVFNAVIRALAGVRVSDCSSGYRALRVASLERLLLRQDQFHTAELIIEAARQGLRIGEAPITVHRRLSGSSKKGKNWSYGASFARTVLKTWWR
jgi:Glycosyl transferase family 2